MKKFKIFIILIFITSCAQNIQRTNTKSFNAKGFAYIYNEDDFKKRLIKLKLDNDLLEISHNKLRSGALIKIINPKTSDEIILKNKKKSNYPDFYKLLITAKVANKLNLNFDVPFIEIIELKKNKSFVAKKTKIFNEEKKIHSNAPVDVVKIDNISKNKSVKNKAVKEKMYIIVGEFYQKSTAEFLKERITQQLTNFNSKKLLIKTNKMKKTSLLSGPYNSINLIKNDYILLKNFGFEELDISLNE